MSPVGERQCSPQVVFKLRLGPIGGLPIRSSPSFTLRSAVLGLVWPCSHCLYRWGWSIFLQQSLCSGWFVSSVSIPIVAWRYRGLGVEVSSVKAPVRSRLQAVRADFTGLVSWLSSMGLAHASIRRGSSGSQFGTGLTDITGSGQPPYQSGLLGQVTSGLY